STARDMTILGRHVFYDYPDYYNLFSRRTTDAGIKQVANTNRRFLGAYRGADGIKTGYTRAAGFNLVASAERGQERIITTVFGGRSTATRNAKVAELMDLGFKRAPSRASVRKPRRPAYVAEVSEKIVRVSTAVKRSPRPLPRPTVVAPASEDLLIAMDDSILDALNVAAAASAVTENAADIVAAAALPEGETAEAAEAPVIPDVMVTAATEGTMRPQPRPGAPAPEVPPVVAEVAAEETPQAPVDLASADPALVGATLAFVPAARPRDPVDPTTLSPSNAIAPAPRPQVVSRISTSGSRHYGIYVGSYGTRDQAERVLLQTALTELGTLDTALRKVVQKSGSYDANFVGMTADAAALACRRLKAREMDCQEIGPS
ncbi:MAG: D-alanyl-D-alanine carboxypeptidase, partial [Pseudomonadota bacterium]